MGSLVFLLPDPLPTVAVSALPSARFAHGPEQTVGPAGIRVQGDRVVVSPVLEESGYLLMPWPIGVFGTLVVTSATIRGRDEPYRLLVELARGKLNQVRTQTFEWQGIGLVTPEAFDRSLAATTRLFCRAVHASPTEADALAARVLDQSFILADELTREFVAQLFDTRRSEEGRLETRLAARNIHVLGDVAPEYTRTFNAAQIAMRWREIEREESRYDWEMTDRAVAAAVAADLPVTIGPVIDLAHGMLPEWATGWEGDVPTLAAFMCDFLEAAVRRYKHDVRRWVVCSGFNHSDALGLGGDDRLRLAFRLFEAAGHIDPGLELVLGIAQPWGDYLSDSKHSLSPLTFPDDLIRSGLKLSAVELEIRSGVIPRGSLPRDLLDTARLINLFGVLGLPLEVTLSLPSSGHADPAAEQGESVWTPGWRAGPSAEGQGEWGASFAALALCVPHVRAVTWDHWSDADYHLTPTGGLIDSAGRPKPLLSRLRTLRGAYLR